MLRAKMWCTTSLPNFSATRVRYVKIQPSPSCSPAYETDALMWLTCVRNRCLNVMRNRQIQERIGRLYLLDLETSILSEPQLREEMESLNEGISHLQAFFSFPPSQPVPLSHFFLGSFLLISFIINRLPSNLLQHPLLQFFPDSFAQFRNSE